MNPDVELLRIMSQVGYLTCFRSDAKRSQLIMDGVSAIGREQIPIKIGVAVADLYAGRYDQAISILRDQILVEDPNHMSAKCFLGIALTQKGKKSDAKELFEEVAVHGNQDEKIIAVAYLNN
ncbi:MAG: hypothetical protein RL122_580 [Pseudomonadota bacterium]|jgi:hypothetical protein|uniref:Tetratricopeptide repeat protein n=1 Tax=Thiothrix fructosivorans TaxID=111770 RepID=A0A8B0SFR8_9GAMM|nr:tetratricopeptide repeat protein [Thiothrix fructosivorans]MBO0614429.1 tetratricopeptide repeat protein [Thiothrix fructosivorans]QTX09270.1 tetratricopeptide repeat protein [Thiothrix fructosivorans]